MSYQQITILGNLGSDPDLRDVNGTPVCNFSVATSRKWTTSDGQQGEKTVWFKVTAWRRQAELASQYLVKGRQVLVVGEVEEPDVWTDKDGNTRASNNVTARTIQFVGGRTDNDSPGNHSSPDVDYDSVKSIPF